MREELCGAEKIPAEQVDPAKLDRQPSPKREQGEKARTTLRTRTGRATTGKERRRNCWGGKKPHQSEDAGGVAQRGATIVTSKGGAKQGGNSHQRPRNEGKLPRRRQERGELKPRSHFGGGESTEDTKLGGGPGRSGPVSSPSPSQAPSSATSVRPKAFSFVQPFVREGTLSTSCVRGCTPKDDRRQEVQFRRKFRQRAVGPNLNTRRENFRRKVRNFPKIFRESSENFANGLWAPSGAPEV